MKIQAGTFKGTLISTKSKAEIRPTSDKVKEWVFQMIEDIIPDAQVIDLFAGSGSLGLESMSRGCSFTVFVDIGTRQLLKQNIQRLDTKLSLKIYEEDVIKFLKRRHSDRFKFSLVFADPPYQFPSFGQFFDSLLKSGIIAPGGVFVLEHGRHYTPELPEPFLTLLREKQIGDTIIKIFQKET